MGLPVRHVLRRKGTPYDELGLDDPEWTDKALIDLMVEQPIVIERPIVVTPEGVRLCRPAELVLDILPDPRGSAAARKNAETAVDRASRELPPAAVRPRQNRRQVAAFRHRRMPSTEGTASRTAPISAATAVTARRTIFKTHGRCPGIIVGVGLLSVGC
jgi:hypothetical protein